MKTRLQKNQKVATGMLGFRTQDSGCKIQDTGFKIQDSGFSARLPDLLRYEIAGLIGLVWFALSVSTMPFVSAHDTGLGHSRRTLLWEARPDRFILEYRIRLPKDEVILEMVKIDTDGNGEISDREKESFFKQKGERLATKFTITDEKPVAALFKDFLLGHSFTQTYRFEIVTGNGLLTFEDRNFRDKPGSVRILKSKSTRVSLAQPGDLQHAEVIHLKIERAPVHKDEN
jgi:hypothetical protein